MIREVYLDLENSSPVAEDVLEEMLPLFNRKAYGHTGMTHSRGWEAYEILQQSLSTMGSALGLESGDAIHIVHDTTEANNLAIMGPFRSDSQVPKGIIASRAEPLSVIHCVERLEKQGHPVSWISVNSEGFIDQEMLADKLNPDIRLVTLSAVNPEVGTVQDIRSIIKLVREKAPEALFHSDLSDAFGKIPFSLPDLAPDMATLSSSKILGPRGVAGLYVMPGIKLSPLIEGAYSTQPLWPGDENIPAIAGFASAIRHHFDNFDQTLEKLARFRNRLIDSLLTIPDSKLNGSAVKRASDNVNISFLKAEGEALTVDLSDRGIFLSSGSACSRKILQPSHILMAMGRKHEEAHGSLLMKVHRLLTDQDIDYVLQQFPESIDRMRRIAGV